MATQINSAPQVEIEGRCILVVEDQFIIAFDIAETVEALGHNVQGPFADRRRAMSAIDQQMPDVAILDVMAADGEVFPLADALTQAGVPIIFHSGHACADYIAKHYPDAMAASKPCPPSQLIEMIEKACERVRSSAQ